MAAAGASLLAACSEPIEPRNFADFMEDRFAREGTLARCNENREATLNDIECANARRAAAAIALRRERDQRESLERESASKLAALRDQLAARERVAQLEAENVAAQQERAYEEMWRGDEPVLAPVGVPEALVPRTVTAAPQTPRAPSDGLEEVVVSGKFGWRPAVD